MMFLKRELYLVNARSSLCHLQKWLARILASYACEEHTMVMINVHQAKRVAHGCTPSDQALAIILYPETGALGQSGYCAASA